MSYVAKMRQMKSAGVIGLDIHSDLNELEGLTAFSTNSQLSLSCTDCDLLDEYLELKDSVRVHH